MSTNDVHLGRGQQICRKQDIIRSTIINNIKKGVYAGRLPNTHSLAKELGVNHKTLGKVLKQLSSEGILLRKRGIGTIIKNLPELKINLRGISPDSTFFKQACALSECKISVTDSDKDHVDISRATSESFIHELMDLQPIDILLKNKNLYDLLPEQALRAFKFKGSLYALPMSYSAEIHYINKNLLKKNHVPIPDPDMTLDDFVKYAKKFRDGYFYGTMPDFTRFLPYLWHVGLPVTTDDSVIIDYLCKKESINAFESFRMLYRHSYSPEWEKTWFQLYRDFAEGRTAVLTTGAYLFQTLSEEAKQRTILNPLCSHGVSKTRLYADGYSIKKTCSDLDNARKFLEGLLDDTVQEAFSKEGMPLPAYPKFRKDIHPIFPHVMQNAHPLIEGFPYFLIGFMNREFWRFMNSNLSAEKWLNEILPKAEILRKAAEDKYPAIDILKFNLTDVLRPP